MGFVHYYKADADLWEFVHTQYIITGLMLPFGRCARPYQKCGGEGEGVGDILISIINYSIIYNCLNKWFISENKQPATIFQL